MRKTSALSLFLILIVAIVISLTPVCNVVTGAKTVDSLDEVSILGTVSNESLVAIDAAAKQTQTDLAAIQARLKTQLADLAISTSKAVELLNQLKEARVDSRAERFQRAQALLEAEAKIKADNEAINQQIQEAKERAEAARDQALVALVLTCVSAAIQTSSAASALAQGDTAAFNTQLQKQLFNANVQVLEIRKDLGLTVRLRVGQLTSCLSTKRQCSGLSFSNTK